MKNIILLAPPATGKGTLAKTLKDMYGYDHISTGDMLREAVEKDDELGRKLDEIMKSGNLVSDDLIYQLLENRLKEVNGKGYILDGFPRNVAQARKYEEIAAKINSDLAIVILMDIDKEELKVRCTGRRSCPKCGRIYNVFNPEMQPKDNKLCLDCDVEVIQREDDNIETFEKRYSTYLEKTQPLIDYYCEKNNLYKIYAGGQKEETLEKALALLNSLGEKID